MIKKIINKLWKVEGMEFTDAPSESKGLFHLKYGDLLIGILTYEANVWTFEYSDEFRNQSNINPIIDFPDVSKVYKNNDLWPFFASRIPSINQEFQLKKIRKANIDSNNAVELLKLFGSETITNPFKLSSI
jgi:HipA-like protein